MPVQVIKTKQGKVFVTPFGDGMVTIKYPSGKIVYARESKSIKAATAMKVNFYSATSGTPKIVIAMELVEGKIKPAAVDKYKAMAKDILTQPGITKDGKYVYAATPKEFLESMPNSYLGSYFWAEVAK